MLIADYLINTFSKIFDNAMTVLLLISDRSTLCLYAPPLVRSSNPPNFLLFTHSIEWKANLQWHMVPWRAPDGVSDNCDQYRHHSPDQWFVAEWGSTLHPMVRGIKPTGGLDSGDQDDHIDGHHIWDENKLMICQVIATKPIYLPAGRRLTMTKACTGAVIFR